MYAILTLSDNAGKVLATLGTRSEVNEKMARWYETAKEGLGEDAADDLIDSLIVVTLH